MNDTPVLSDVEKSWMAIDSIVKAIGGGQVFNTLFLFGDLLNKGREKPFHELDFDRECPGFPIPWNARCYKVCSLSKPDVKGVRELYLECEKYHSFLFLVERDSDADDAPIRNLRRLVLDEQAALCAEFPDLAIRFRNGMVRLVETERRWHQNDLQMLAELERELVRTLS